MRGTQESNVIEPIAHTVAVEESKRAKPSYLEL